MSFSLFNFQGSVARFALLTSLLIVSHSFGFVKRFFKFSSKFFFLLENFYFPLTASRLRQLDYSITSSSLCQVLFLIFFKIFFRTRFATVPASACSFPSIGRLPALLSLPSLCDSFAILSLHFSIVKHKF